MATLHKMKNQGNRIEVSGCEIQLEHFGSGDPLLYLHSDRGGAWLPFLEQLSTQYDVLAPEHPGFGHSDMPEWFDTIHDLAYFYLDFLEKLDLENVHLVGNGMGGWIACELAVRSTQRLTSLTLIGSYGLRVVGSFRPDVFLWTREETIRNLVVDQSLADAFLEKEISDEDIDLYNKTRRAAARVGWSPRFYDPNLPKWLHRVDVPTLILWGAEDKLLPSVYAQEFARLIPNSEVVIFENAGHILHIEQMEKFIEVFNTFIERKIK